MKSDSAELVRDFAPRIGRALVNGQQDERTRRYIGFEIDENSGVRMKRRSDQSRAGSDESRELVDDRLVRRNRWDLGGALRPGIALFSFRTFAGNQGSEQADGQNFLHIEGGLSI